MWLVSSLRAALCLLLAVLASHRQPAAAVVTLSTSSRWIVDPAGHRVKLACVNWPSHLESVVTEGLGRQPVGACWFLVASCFVLSRWRWCAWILRKRKKKDKVHAMRTGAGASKHI